MRASCPVRPPARHHTVAVALAAVLAPSARAAAQADALGLGLTAVGETGVVTNPRFQTALDSGDVLSRMHVGVSLARRSARGAFTATVDGDLQQFRAAPDLSRSTYGAGASADRRLTPRIALSGTAGLRTSLSRDVVTGAGFRVQPDATGGGVASTPLSGTSVGASDAGTAGLPLLPLTVSHAYTADAQVGYRASPLTTVSGGLGVDRVRYETGALASGTSERVVLSVAHQLRVDAGLSATFDSRRTQTDGRHLATEAATVGWDMRVSGSARLRLSAGVSASTAPSTSTAIGTVGSAEIAMPRLGGVWAIRYVRDVSPSLGVGQLLTSDQAGASYTRIAPGGMLVHIGVEQAWVRLPATAASQAVMNTSFADVRRPITGGFWAGAGAAHRTRTQGLTARSQNLSLTAGYTGSW